MFPQQSVDLLPGILASYFSRHEQESFNANEFLAVKRSAEFADSSDEKSSSQMNVPADENSNDNSLEDAVRDEHEYLRKRLRDELQRDPTEAELDEWLRQHTEGY
jgi:hypothetical protein